MTWVGAGAGALVVERGASISLRIVLDVREYICSICISVYGITKWAEPVSWHPLTVQGMSYSIFRPPAPIPRPDPPPALRLPDVPTALVTGANGFLGLEIVKQLLEKGYHVRASVRDVQDAKKTTSLVKVGRALPGSWREGDLGWSGHF